MRKVIVYFVDKCRKLKHYISTFLFKRQLVSYGDHIGAAKIIKISRKAKVSIGCHCGFNGMTISGLGGGGGGVKIGNYFHSGTDILIMLGSHDYEYGDKIPYGSHYKPKNVVIDDFVWLGSNVIISGNVHIWRGSNSCSWFCCSKRCSSVCNCGWKSCQNYKIQKYIPIQNA